MNVFELYASIILDRGDYEQGLDEAGKKTSEFSQKLKSGLATAAKIGTAAITAAAAGITALTKSAVEEYGEYEQLVGGVETLFKSSAGIPAIRGRRFSDCGAVGKRLHEYRYQLFGVAFAVP